MTTDDRAPVAAELEAPSGARWVALDEMLGSSDVVSVSCPYNAGTRHLIDAAALGRMRATAHLVNTARNVAAVLAGDPPLTPVGRPGKGAQP